jgi:uncharacterized membrane protein required for colicin V production
MNLLFIIVVAFLILKIAQGFKRGMVKEIVSLITLSVLCIIAGLVSFGLRSYANENYLGLIIAAVIFIAVFVIHHLLGLVLFPLKLFSKLPMVHTLDKLLGAVFGVIETVFLLWLVYTIMMEGHLGVIGTLLIEQTKENPLLTWVFDNNYLRLIVEKLLQISANPFV